MSIKLLLATANRGKIREYRSLLEGVPYEIVTLDDVQINEVASESGTTFAENAIIKAKDCASKSGLLTIADDSGLEVAALGGTPGIYSSRYAGEGASDRDRIDLLLHNLRDVPAENRDARFVCVIAVAAIAGEESTFYGECRGIIIFESRGNNGFGYDPVFLVTELGKTMAELTEEEKNQVSHRARAAAKAREYLLQRALEN